MIKVLGWCSCVILDEHFNPDISVGNAIYKKNINDVHLEG